MKKLLAATLAMAMMAAPMLPAYAEEEAPEPITLTVFRGDPGDQPAPVAEGAVDIRECNPEDQGNGQQIAGYIDKICQHFVTFLRFTQLHIDNLANVYACR